MKRNLLLGILKLIFCTICIVFWLILIIGDTCAPPAYEDSHDGRGDMCGASSVYRYAGHEVCWACYIRIQKNWEKTHPNE